MSRLGRDYLKVGYYTEIFFVERDMRYISINDGVDSTKGTTILPRFATYLMIFTPKIQVKKYGQSNGRKDRRGNI